MSDDAEQMVADLENRESKLSDWEREFVDSLRHRLDNGYGLTERQQEKLEEVWERAT